MCCIMLLITFRMRGEAFGPVALMTLLVKFGSKLCVFGALSILLAVLLD